MKEQNPSVLRLVESSESHRKDRFGWEAVALARRIHRGTASRSTPLARRCNRHAEGPTLVRAFNRLRKATLVIPNRGRRTFASLYANLIDRHLTFPRIIWVDQCATGKYSLMGKRGSANPTFAGSRRFVCGVRVAKSSFASLLPLLVESYN